MSCLPGAGVAALSVMSAGGVNLTRDGTLQVFYPGADSAPQPDPQLIEFAPARSSFQKIRDVRHRRARDVFRRGMLRIDTRREVDACFSKQVLHKRRAVE